MEPIFFPKLQIQFADFPCLLSSVRLEAANLEDLLRFRYGSREESMVVPSAFQGSRGTVLWPATDVAASWGSDTGSPGNPRSAVSTPQSQRVLRLGQRGREAPCRALKQIRRICTVFHPRSRCSFASPPDGRREAAALSWTCGISTAFPFACGVLGPEGLHTTH